MALPKDMYSAKNNSPITTLAEALNSSDSVMILEDASALPEAPNLAVIGSSENAEIVKYTSKNGNSLNIIRGINYTQAGTWSKGTPVARNFTAEDHESFLENIRYLETYKADKNDTYSKEETDELLNTKPDLDDVYPKSDTYSKEETDSLLGNKQGVLNFDSTPTAGSGNPVTSGGVKAYVDSHDDFKITGTVSSSGYTLTDSRINDEHWEVEQIYFATPSNVTSSDIDWSTNITDHTLTLSATYAGSTSVIVKMHWVQ